MKVPSIKSKIHSLADSIPPIDIPNTTTMKQKYCLMTKSIYITNLDLNLAKNKSDQSAS